MKTAAVILALFAAAAAAVWQTPFPAAPTMAGMAPAGPVLVLEANDFASLVRDWQSSKEKANWLQSDNYRAFSTSMLLLRLAQLRDEFAGAAGLAPDMSLVESVAGTHSILALYNLREIEFVYITRLPTAQAVQSVLWQKRNDYQPRQSAGVTYYVRSEGERQVAFAASGDYLLLATREDLMGRALELMNTPAGARIPAVTSDAWFSQAIAVAGQPGDLRLTLDLQTLARAPQFRSYWIQNNVSDLRAYRAAVADVRRESGQIREERLMLRMEPADAPAPLGAEIAGMVPEGAGLYRMWSSPSVDMVVGTLRHKVLASGPPRVAGMPVAPQQIAPDSSDNSDSNGGADETEPRPASFGRSSTDLETRIDQAPLPETGAFDERPLRKLLAVSTPRSMLVTQTARDIPGGVFETTRVAVIVEADSWDVTAVRGVFGAAATVRGRFLIAGDPGSTRAGAQQALPAGVVYAGGFAHAQERGGYIKMLRVMDRVPPWMAQMGTPDQPRAPMFFAGNLASLSNTLSRLASLSIVVRDTGRALQQTVIYRMAP
jgi:hypothetical protein